MTARYRRPDDCDDERRPHHHDCPPPTRPIRCGCSCHGEAVVHVSLTCDCGKPIEPCDGAICPPPPQKEQPGIVDIPEQPPPFHPPTSDTPSWKDPDRPPRGSVGEIPWFRGKLADLQRKGPTFGPRKDEFLPYLLIRAAGGDRGARPYSGVFWESPDIFVLPRTDASAAPLMPVDAGGVAEANRPNTLYAHVWNLGKAPAYRVRVEFYWFNPSLGFSRSAANLVGATYVDLANRFTHLDHWTEIQAPYGHWLSRGCHAIVRCPTTWVPTYENGGHECLVVRAFEPLLDGLSPDQFSPAADRHVGQRNIAVVQASSPASLDLVLDLGWRDRPGDAEVDLEVVPPNSMEWLRVLTRRRDPGLAPPAAEVAVGLLPPAPAGSARRVLGLEPGAGATELLAQRERFHRGCDALELTLHASIANLEPNEAQVVRVRQRVDGEIAGGYSVVLVGAGHAAAAE
jgi:hypothetical protein